jgi:hypothetical protein
MADIRWSVWKASSIPKISPGGEGKDPDGTQLNTDMPRWNIGNDDLADLIDYLKTLP